MSTQTKVKLPHFCAPITYDEYLEKILLALFKTGKAATSKEIGDKASLKDFECVGRSASFLNYLGLVDGERSHFSLTPLGRQIAIALHEDKKEKADELWQQVLKGHNLYSELHEYIKAQGGVQGTSLGFAEHLRTLADKKWTTMFLQEGGKRICTLFANKKLLKFNRDDDSISFQSVTTLKPTPPPPAGGGTSGASQGQEPPSGALSYNINITVEAKDAESIREVINLLRELTGRKQTS